jgi:phosphatidate phosphatase PAH1
MTSLEKLAVYFDSFTPEDPNYDYACFLREKIASVVPGPDTPATQQMHEEDNNESHEMETAGQDKAKENLEGKLMEPAFQDLEAMNQIEKEKTEKKAETNPVRSLLDKLSKKS